jgi:PAS domain S-box-containing protein
VIADTLIQVLDQTADGVLITDREGVIEYVNPAFETLTGFTRDQAVGHSPNMVRSGVQTPQFYTTLWTTIGTGRPFHGTLTNRARDGHLFQYEQTITPIVNSSGETTHYAASRRGSCLNSSRKRRASEGSCTTRQASSSRSRTSRSRT